MIKVVRTQLPFGGIYIPQALLEALFCYWYLQVRWREDILL